MPEKILLLSDVNSSHTRKIAIGLAGAGISVGIFSISKRTQDWFSEFPAITVFDERGLDAQAFHASSAGKLVYLRQVRSLKNIIREFRPQIVHAHYATSYGMIGWLAGFHPYVISAWGSDLLDFPGNGLKKALLKRILRSADLLMATSRTLEKAVLDIDGRKPLVTPFGVDTEIFRPAPVAPVFPEGTFVFGTVKSLEKVYGTETLIRAFALLREKNPQRKMALLLVGDGTQRAALEELAAGLGAEADIRFQGRIDHSEVASWHNRIGVFMNLSLYESFGVSVLESMACGKPVVVSDTGGLAEIVDQELNGIRIPAGDVQAACAAMQRFLDDPGLAEKMGRAGREKVIREYTWQKTMDLMTGAYRGLLPQAPAQ